MISRISSFIMFAIRAGCNPCCSNSESDYHFHQVCPLMEPDLVRFNKTRGLQEY